MSGPLIEVPCSQCGKPWQPTRAHFTRGLWRVCDACRGALTADRMPAGSDDPADSAGGDAPDREADRP